MNGSFSDSARDSDRALIERRFFKDSLRSIQIMVVSSFNTFENASPSLDANIHPRVSRVRQSNPLGDNLASLHWFRNLSNLMITRQKQPHT
jgi:hypothetical protein